MSKIIILIILIIVVIIVVSIFYSRKKNCESSKSRKPIVANKRVLESSLQKYRRRVHYNECIATEMNIPENSLVSSDILEKTIEIHKSSKVQKFMEEAQKVFGTGKVIWGYKNTNIWELYIYMHSVNIQKFVEGFQKLFPNDIYNFDPLLKRDPFLVSLLVTDEIIEKRITPSLNPYYFIDSEVMYEDIYSHEGIFTKRTIYMRPVDLTNFDILSDYISKSNLSAYSNTTTKIVRNLAMKYNVRHSTLANKPKEIGLYLFRLEPSMFLEFLKEFGYNRVLIEYVENNLSDLKNFDHEVGIHFDKETGKVTRTAFYGVL